MLCRTVFEGLRQGRRLPAHPLDQYTVGEILMLTEGSLVPVSCLTPCDPMLPHGKLPHLRDVGRLNDLISNYFRQYHTADLARPDQAGNDYVI